MAINARKKENNTLTCSTDAFILETHVLSQFRQIFNKTHQDYAGQGSF